MINFYHKAKKNQKGFTLVELMVVVVIIGILVAIAIPVYTSSQRKAKGSADKANERIIQGAMQMYLMEESDTAGFYTEVNNEHPLVVKEYLKEAPQTSEGGFYTINEDGTITGGTLQSSGDGGGGES